MESSATGERFTGLWWMRIWRIELAARRRVVPLVRKAIVGHARLIVVGLGTRFADRTIRGDERRHGVVDAIASARPC
jgi:hypothetical protein